MTKTDIQLKQDIEDELRWDPTLNAAQIGVTVDNGVVTLLGAVDTYSEKRAAELATKRVNGVRTLSQDLTVKLAGVHRRSDADLATATQNALTWDVRVPLSVTARVEGGVVTLAGEVTWNYQRDAAERAVRHLKGIVSVENTISLTATPPVAVAAVREKIEAALQRQATEDASTIKIEASGSTVTLTGEASSFRSIEDARKAAWSTLGVVQVIDHVKMALAL
jgi:osmotically-inducible protein OsmY